MDRQELIALQIEAAAVLDAGQRLAVRAAKRAITPRERSRLCGEALGGSLAKPSEFWAGAAVIEAGSDVVEVEALGLSVRLASAQLAAGNLDFVRESLVGQAQWASVLAVKLGAQADGEDKLERQVVLVKLALAAQRQAAAALCSAAALNKLVEADSVTVGSDF